MSPSATAVDVIVVGLGAMGSAVTWQLAQRGVRVVGIDRFDPPHDRGSTHGETRITRVAIGEGPEYVPFVRRSHELWGEIERGGGPRLLHQVGGLVIGDRDDSFLGRTRAAAEQHGVAHEHLNREQLADRFPMFHTPPGTEAYFEPTAGYVRPEAAVATQLQLARAAGAELRLGERVIAWEAGPSETTVVTDRGTLRARELVICAGAWIGELLPESAGTFAIYPQWLHWFPIVRGAEALARMPIFIWEMAGERDEFTHLAAGFYGFPAIDGASGGVKVATERYDAMIDPDQRADTDAVAGAAAAAELHDALLAHHFPWIGSVPLRTVSCLYTSARGSRFLIGRHPAHPRLTVVAACSGHGFKHSPAIGEAVAQTITEGTSELDLSPFAIPAGALG